MHIKMKVKTNTKMSKLQRGYIKTQLIAVAKNHPINKCLSMVVGFQAGSVTSYFSGSGILESFNQYC